MPIPDFQTLMLPVLQRIGHAQASIREVVRDMMDRYALTEAERSALLPSGRQAVIENRVNWAVSYLNKAGLVQRVARGIYRASERGRGILLTPPSKIDIGFLRQFPEFLTATIAGTGTASTATISVAVEAATETRTPEERIGDAATILRAELRERLLQRLREADPAFFERVVMDLLLGMGYGAGGQAGIMVGGSGDGGIDGVIREDRLGLDLIYIQAKRYALDNVIGPDRVREFAGALDVTSARKGVLITTSRFSDNAAAFARNLQTKRIVLIDGGELSDLMIEHGVGVRPRGEPILIKEIDLNYFEPDGAV